MMTPCIFGKFQGWVVGYLANQVLSQLSLGKTYGKGVIIYPAGQVCGDGQCLPHRRAPAPPV